MALTRREAGAAGKVRKAKEAHRTTADFYSTAELRPRLFSHVLLATIVLVFVVVFTARSTHSPPLHHHFTTARAR